MFDPAIFDNVLFDSGDSPTGIFDPAIFDNVLFDSGDQGDILEPSTLYIVMGTPRNYTVKGSR